MGAGRPCGIEVVRMRVTVTLRSLLGGDRGGGGNEGKTVLGAVGGSAKDE